MSISSINSSGSCASLSDPSLFTFLQKMSTSPYPREWVLSFFPNGMTAQKVALLRSEEVIDLLTCAFTHQTSLFLEHISHLDIDENTKIGVARACAKKNGSKLAEHIHKFNISDQNTLTDIAQICATGSDLQTVYKTAFYIQNFNISNEAARIKIAWSCIKQFVITASLIQKFTITDQTALIDMAACCAKKNGSATASLIQKFNITNSVALMTIAKMCVEQNRAALEKLPSEIAKLIMLMEKLSPFTLDFLNRHHLVETLLSLKKHTCYENIFEWFISFFTCTEEEMIKVLSKMFVFFQAAIGKNDAARFQGSQREKRLPLTLCFLFASLLGHAPKFLKWMQANRNALRDLFKVQKTLEILVYLMRMSFLSPDKKQSFLRTYPNKFLNDTIPDLSEVTYDKTLHLPI